MRNIKNKKISKCVFTIFTEGKLVGMKVLKVTGKKMSGGQMRL